MAETVATHVSRPPTPAPLLVLAVLIGVNILLMLGFMTIGARGSWDFVLAFRGQKLLTLILVGGAVALSTVVFQTITQNRILTPAIMGFDALFVLLQSVLVFVFGGFAILTFHPHAMFTIEVLVMTGFALSIYGFLFFGARRSLHLVMLVGIVLGVLFRSVTALVSRLIDPNEYAILQDLFYAGFGAVETDLLVLSGIFLIIGACLAWHKFPVWDVISLGRDTAINLGINYRLEVMIALVIITVFISVSTALVGPVTFFGLLVANLAYLIMPTHRHAYVIPAAILLATICLIAGQMILERLLGFNSALSIVIEFVGGLVFLFLLVKGKAQ